MLFVPPLSDLDGEYGLWSRTQLEEMDSAFIRAVERAFELGLESRAAAAATVRVGALRNGKDAVIESAIEAAWDFLCRKRGDATALEIVKFIRERCPNLDQARIRFGFEQRLRQRGAGW
jgi:hypothetical protein